MFDKFKQAKKIKELKSDLQKQKETVEKEGVKVVVTGQMKVESINIGEGVDSKKVPNLVKECTNEALQNVQKIAAKKMKEAGDFF